MSMLELGAVEEVVLEGETPDADVDLVLIPLKRSDLVNLKVTRFSDAEAKKLNDFQEWLSITINPSTGQPFIPSNGYSSLVQFCLNVTFREMATIAEAMAQAEEVTS